MSHGLDQWVLGATAFVFAVALVLSFALSRRADGSQRTLVVTQLLLLIAGLALMAWLVVRQPTPALAVEQEIRPEWKQTGPGITEGISGLALIAADKNEASFVAVHDNKRAGQKRLSIIRRASDGSVDARPLAWTGEPLPVDLEAISRVPGASSTFLTLTSKGAVHRFLLHGQSGIAFDAGPVGVPNSGEERQFESFDVQQVGGAIFACWAERGDKAAPGVIFCSTFHPGELTFGTPQSIEVRAPWPTTATRHISDLRLLADGTIIAASASDPGDAGPFSGAVFVAGTLQPIGDVPQLVAASPSTRLFTTTTHKIEALEVVPGESGGLVLGSDDENLGAAVLFTW